MIITQLISVEKSTEIINNKDNLRVRNVILYYIENKKRIEEYFKKIPNYQEGDIESFVVLDMFQTKHRVTTVFGKINPIKDSMVQIFNAINKDQYDFFLTVLTSDIRAPYFNIVKDLVKLENYNDNDIKKSVDTLFNRTDDQTNMFKIGIFNNLIAIIIENIIKGYINEKNTNKRNKYLSEFSSRLQGTKIYEIKYLTDNHYNFIKHYVNNYKTKNQYINCEKIRQDIYKYIEETYKFLPNAFDNIETIIEIAAKNEFVIRKNVIAKDIIIEAISKSIKKYKKTGSAIQAELKLYMRLGWIKPSDL